MRKIRVKSVIELLKPITWFAPMWAYMCGAISAGPQLQENWKLLILGIILAGPLVCGASQALNDWFDRDVDAINEPNRPIPSGRIPGAWGLYIAIFGFSLSILVSSLLGPWVMIAAALAILFGWAYSAPPLRLKQNGWLGNLACGVCYEGLPWFTAAAVAATTLPDGRTVILALLYSLGAHGIMTLNDFKAMDGDRALGIKTIPVQLGASRAAKLACIVMATPQIAVIVFLNYWGAPIYSIAVIALLLIQFSLMPRLLRSPGQMAPWYNATGTSLYVCGMLVSAFALRSIG